VVSVATGGSGLNWASGINSLISKVVSDVSANLPIVLGALGALLALTFLLRQLVVWLEVNTVSVGPLTFGNGEGADAEDWSYEDWTLDQAIKEWNLQELAAETRVMDPTELVADDASWVIAADGEPLVAGGFLEREAGLGRGDVRTVADELPDELPAGLERV
jgi:hypothetical protein